MYQVNGRPASSRIGSGFAASLADSAEPPKAIRARLRALEAVAGGRLGVHILDTSAGKEYGYRQDERFMLLSTFKLLACALVLHRVDAGQESLVRRISYTQADVIDGSPITGKHADGSGMTLAELCEAALTASDNTAANLILSRYGADHPTAPPSWWPRTSPIARPAARQGNPPSRRLGNWWRTSQTQAMRLPPPHLPASIDARHLGRRMRAQSSRVGGKSQETLRLRGRWCFAGSGDDQRANGKAIEKAKCGEGPADVSSHQGQRANDAWRGHQYLAGKTQVIANPLFAWRCLHIAHDSRRQLQD